VRLHLTILHAQAFGWDYTSGVRWVFPLIVGEAVRTKACQGTDLAENLKEAAQ